VGNHCQFEGLWKQVEVNEFGNLDYNQFLRWCVADDVVSRPATAISLPASLRSKTPLTGRPVSVFSEV
jgi:hypothetical protein